MTPVFQTIISATEGNCMQAAFASLLDLPLEATPDFKFNTEGKNKTWFGRMYNFLYELGYEYKGSIRNPKDFGSWGEDRMDKISELSPGLNGFYYGVVYSPAFSDFNVFRSGLPERPTTHAVIVDSKCNIVHDPNPGNAGLFCYPGHGFLGHNGVLEVYMIERRTDL